MAKGYSEDLRECVIRYLDEGGSKAEASRIFKLSYVTIWRWINLREEQGHLRAKVAKRKWWKIDEEKLERYIWRNPDKTLKELGREFGVSDVGILKALRRLGMSHKKKSSLSRER